MKIQILGPGCTKCVKTHQVVKKAVEMSGVDATVEKIEDIVEILKFNVMTTPAVVIDGDVKIKGRVPSEKEIIDLLK